MSHDLTSLDIVARLFDFLLANNPAMVSYLGVAVRLYLSNSLLLKSDHFLATSVDYFTEETGIRNAR